MVLVHKRLHCRINSLITLSNLYVIHKNKLKHRLDSNRTCRHVLVGALPGADVGPGVAGDGVGVTGAGVGVTGAGVGVPGTGVGVTGVGVSPTAVSVTPTGTCSNNTDVYTTESVSFLRETMYNSIYLHIKPPA